MLRHANIEKHGVKDIVTYLRSENYGLEYGLADIENVELASLVGLLERQLFPAVDWFLWCDDTVFAKFTRKCYTTALSQLSAVFMPFRWRKWQMHRTRHSQLTHCLRRKSDTEIENELYAAAKRCLTAMSYILGDKKYFVGERPTAADAYLFSRLWPLLLYESKHGTANWTCPCEAPAYRGHSSTHPLISHVLQCSNLVAHFIRIQGTYFQQAAATFRKEIALSASKRQTADSGLLTIHPLRDCLLVGIGLLAAFLLYARNHGMIRIAAS